MKGLIFNLLEEVVTRRSDDDLWDRMLDRAGLEGAYTSLGTYPDDELNRLLGAAATVLDRPVDAVTRWFGRSAMPLLARRYPVLIAAHVSAHSFLLGIDREIHADVRKLDREAAPPKLDVVEVTPARITIRYRSTRRLCGFAVGLIEGLGDHFGEQVVVTHPTCALRGDPECLVDCRFTERIG